MTHCNPAQHVPATSAHMLPSGIQLGEVVCALADTARVDPTRMSASLDDGISRVLILGLRLRDILRAGGGTVLKLEQLKACGIYAAARAY